MQLQKKKKKKTLHGRSLRLVKSRGSSVSSFENVVQVVRVLSRVLLKIVGGILEEYHDLCSIINLPIDFVDFVNARIALPIRRHVILELYR